jgi:uncharacterized repeat protein (TIGR03803 family)
VSLKFSGVLRLFLLLIVSSTAVQAAEVALQKLYTFPLEMLPGLKFVRGPNGDFFGTATDNVMTDYSMLFAISPQGVFRTVRRYGPYNFERIATPGDGPMMGEDIVYGRDGNIYGLTGGGAYGFGTLFSYSPAGVFTVVYEFTEVLRGKLELQGTDGKLYGSCYGTDASGPYTELFRLGLDGAYEGLAKFREFRPPQLPYDGAPERVSSLILGSDGKLYGTSASGGHYESMYGAYGSYGAVFRVEDDGAVTVLMRGDAVRANPNKLVELADGSFAVVCSAGIAQYGSIVRLTKDGQASDLHLFTGDADGGRPYDLLLGDDGNLYGATTYGGVWHSDERGAGTIFKLATDGTFSLVETLPPYAYPGRTLLASGHDGYVYVVYTINAYYQPAMAFAQQGRTTARAAVRAATAPKFQMARIAVKSAGSYFRRKRGAI